MDILELEEEFYEGHYSILKNNSLGNKHPIGRENGPNSLLTVVSNRLYKLWKDRQAREGKCFPQVYDDGGFSKSKRKETYKRGGNCAIRAMAIATNTPYDRMAFQVRKAINRCRPYHPIKSLKEMNGGTPDYASSYILKKKGWKFVKCNDRLIPENFRNKETLIIHTTRPSHLTVLKDGVIYDSFDTQYSGRFSGKFTPNGTVIDNAPMVRGYWKKSRKRKNVSKS